ncbi:MAG TPA: N-formylglutamate amidohydrolase [Stellaceae bacterium]|nr:N-formylglutamate amidohydrolase [Stellaceae bacterium]
MRHAHLETLLGPDDLPPVEIWHGAGRRPVLLCCDHASRTVPRALNGLGLAPALLARHIGWDIGAAALTRALSRRLDAPALLSGYSRLVIDCNRYPDDPSSIPLASDQVVIPGNQGLEPVAREARLAAIFHPYHAAIARLIERCPVLVSIHSFTPVMNGVERPWAMGVLWDEDPRIAVPLLEALRLNSAHVIGDNQPYSARDPKGYTVHHHAARRGLPHVALEFNQKLIADEAAAAAWAAITADALEPILARLK